MPTLPTAPILPLPVETLWLRGSVASLSTNMFSMPIFRFLQNGILVVATVPAPPAVVCFKSYVGDQCSRCAAIATCSLFGPSARRSHDFTFSSVKPCD